MKLKLVLLFFLIVSSLCFSQGKKSKGDFLFYEYAYKEAIDAYEKELHKKKLTGEQYLNLADSYFKVGNYKRSSKIYLDIYKLEASKKDSLSMMSNHTFNKMLQSLSRSSEIEQVKAYLKTKKDFISPEIIQNAEFNYNITSINKGESLDFEIFNILCNSPQSDFSPSFYKDKFLFTSGRSQKARKIYKPTGESYLDIFSAEINAEGDVLNAKSFKNIPSTNYHRATPFYSTTLDNIFYMLSNTKNDELVFNKENKNALAIGKVDENGAFSFLLKDLSTSFYYPFFDEATSKLYFAADFEDGYGGTDIYYIYTNRGQIMSGPINLGPRINSPGNEIAPFVFENSLYFASDIFYGLGGMDIYKSNLQQDESFSIPVNLGEGINSTYDDFGFIIRNNRENGLLGYFSSNREGGIGNDDIYGFIVKEKPGIKTLSFKGEINNSNTNKSIENASIKVIDTSNTIIKEVFSKEDGSYEIEIPWRDTIRLEVTKNKHSSFVKDYNKESQEEELQQKTLNIELSLLDDLVEEKEDQTVLKLNKFYFQRAKSNVTFLIAKELDKAINVIKTFPELQLRIESHTDSRSGSSTNFRLSQKRADAIKAYLLENGIPASNILYSIGYGEEKLLNKCKNGVFCLEVQHNVNERSLIVILNYNML